MSALTMPNLVAARRERLLLVVLVTAIAAPHAAHLPFWVSTITGLILGWQAVAQARGHRAPTGWQRAGLTAALFGAVFFGFGHIDGANAGVALLMLMLALKLCELSQSRDAVVVLTLCCFVLATQFLFSQSLAMAAYLVAGVWAVLAVFVYLHTLAGAGRAGHAARESATLLGLALPIAAVLFLLFPRLPGPLWGLPAHAGARGITGLSDQMTPGAISQLAQSGAVAFRVRFGDAPPPADQRYWRGPVLWDLDRGTWHNRADMPALKAPRVIPQGPTQRLTITLEPSHQRWLLALDMPINTSHAHGRSAGATLLADAPITSRTRYVETSASRYRLGQQLAPAARRRALALPTRGNPRARALATRWATTADTPSAIVHDALTRFRTQPYRYTLNAPGTSQVDGIDDFLFQTRAGFCEHYAGAFVFLMRAAGVPARVVTGYLGGQPGAYGDYWIVRDADAHAWAEVWMNGRGWVRVDPTAAVAPGRIDRGVVGAVGDTGDLPFMARGRRGDPWFDTRMAWDAVNAGWNQWFLAYGPALQDRLFALLGLSGAGPALAVATLLVVGLLGIASALMGWRMRRAAPVDRIVAAWQRIDRRLARLDLAQHPGETVGDQARRVATARPDLAGAISALATDYARLRYRTLQDRDQRRRFLARARRFRPGRRRR